MGLVPVTEMLQKKNIPAAERHLLLLKEISEAVLDAGRYSSFTLGCASWRGALVASTQNPLPSWWCDWKKRHSLTGSHAHRDYGHRCHVMMWKNPPSSSHYHLSPPKVTPKVASVQRHGLTQCVQSVLVLRGGPAPQQCHHPPDAQENHGRVQLHGRHYWQQKRGKVLYPEGLEKSQMASYLWEILNVDLESSTSMPVVRHLSTTVPLASLQPVQI